MYFGTYTFLIIALLLRTDFIAALVAFEKKVYNSLPVRIYTGKVFPPLPNRLENTTVRTAVVNSGSSRVQRIPR